jgi:crotonobetainyl-CoA:carnitine CoA-transferase CaiB-like acyl-CoA transferase
MPPPLTGVTVLAFEQAVAAPYCTRLLADLGARVIKIEQPGSGGDFARYYDDAAAGLATHFVWLNRNKESLALDCKRPEARAILDRLLDGADVVIQNLAPGAARRLGLDAETLVRDRPHLVAVDVSGYGTGGPLDHRRAYDLLVQAEAGSCASTGTADAPAKPGIPIADVGTGMQAAVSILAALTGRASTGRGAAIQVSLFDTIVDLLGNALIHYRYTGQDRPPLGLSSNVVAPYGAYPTRDGQLVMLGTTNDGEWQRLATQLLDRPDLAADRTLATNAQRLEQRERLDEAVIAWTSTVDIDEIGARATAAGIGHGVYRQLGEVVDHPQVTERQRWVEVGSPVGPVASLLPAFTSTAWAPPLAPVPGLGEHTGAVLAGLGLGADEIEALRAAGAISLKSTSV